MHKINHLWIWSIAILLIASKIILSIYPLKTPFFIFWVVAGSCILSIIRIGLPIQNKELKNQPEQKNQESIESITEENERWIRDQCLEKETAWAKSLYSISALLLSGCVYVLYNKTAHPPEFISCIVFLAIMAILNIVSSSILHLSEFFYLSYPWQEHTALHKFLHHINIKLTAYWHMPSLFFCLAQAATAIYAVLLLAYEN